MKKEVFHGDHDLRYRLFIGLVNSLLGRVSVRVRGVTFGFDERALKIVVYFQGEPSDLDVENMQLVEAEMVSHHEYMSDLRLVSTTESESLAGKEENWGWVFLRYEDKEGVEGSPRSYFAPEAPEIDAQSLVNQHAGTGRSENGVPLGRPGSRERVNFGTVIGKYVDPDTGAVVPTTNGIIHYSKDGAHIIPSRPGP